MKYPFVIIFTITLFFNGCQKDPYIAGHKKVYPDLTGQWVLEIPTLAGVSKSGELLFDATRAATYAADIYTLNDSNTIYEMIMPFDWYRDSIGTYINKLNWSSRIIRLNTSTDSIIIPIFQGYIREDSISSFNALYDSKSGTLKGYIDRWYYIRCRSCPLNNKDVLYRHTIVATN
jgi:hypothetical protein